MEIKSVYIAELPLHSAMLSPPTSGLSKPSKSRIMEEGADLDRSTTDLGGRSRKDVARATSPNRGVPLYDKDLIRTMAEVNFINGEVCSPDLLPESIKDNYCMEWVSLWWM